MRDRNKIVIIRKIRAKLLKYVEKRQNADDILEEKKVFVTVRAKSILAVILVLALAVICCVGLNFEAVAESIAFTISG